MAAMTASASRSCGTAFGWTNEVTSMRGTPASLRRSTTSTVCSVGMNSGSIWNPSRVPTSQIVTCLGSLIVILRGGSSEPRARSVRARHAEDVLADVSEHEVLADGRGLVEPRPAELALDVVLLGVAVPAVAVDAGVPRLPRRLRFDVLRHAGLGAARLARVEERGGLVPHQLRGLDGRVGAG